MLTVRTDLALESHQLWQENSQSAEKLTGVRTAQEQVGHFPLHRVDILDAAGEKALGKPRGTYLTLELSTSWRKNGEIFSEAVSVLAKLLGELLPEDGPVLVAGLGNAAMTPDALGPLVVEHLLVTRHLGSVLPDLRPVSALAGGVLGTTGIEAAEWVRGVSERVRPAAVVLVDALAARSLERLGSTVQLSDTGIVPGSGVGNHRMALNRATLGVPVIALGVPTVVDVRTVARDLLGDRGEAAASEYLPEGGQQLFVTPEDIDRRVRDLAKLIGYAISLATQPGLELEDVTALLA